MKLNCIVDEERHFPSVEHGLIGKVLGFVDGAHNWRLISAAPFNQEFEVSVAEHGHRYVVPFPCRQTINGWVNCDLDVRMNIEPIQEARGRHSRQTSKGHSHSPAPCYIAQFTVTRGYSAEATRRGAVLQGTRKRVGDHEN